MIVPPKSEDESEVYIMTQDGKIIPSVKHLKILGVNFNASNTMETHNSAIALKTGLAYKKLKPYIIHAPPKQRKIMMTSKQQLIALYCSPLFFNESMHCKKRLESVIMNINKRIYNKNTFIVKYKDICQDIKVDEQHKIHMQIDVRVES